MADVDCLLQAKNKDKQVLECDKKGQKLVSKLISIHHDLNFDETSLEASISTSLHTLLDHKFISAKLTPKKIDDLP